MKQDTQTHPDEISRLQEQRRILKCLHRGKKTYRETRLSLASDFPSERSRAEDKSAKATKF